MGSERGFTLIELLTIIVIIGVLAALGLTSFSVYRASAAYATCEKTLRDARTDFEGSLNNVDSEPPAVGLYSQGTQGALADPSANELLPNFRLPRLTKFQVSFDPACEAAGCEQVAMQVNHCQGDEYTRYIRFGDGLDVLLEHISGVGCP